MVGSKGIIKDNDGNTFQCKYFVQRKKRYCRMTVRPGKSYCGEHDPAKESDGIEVSFYMYLSQKIYLDITYKKICLTILLKMFFFKTDTRVPCPLDPKQ